MSAQSSQYIVEASVDVEIPAKREYNSAADAELDQQLLETIEAAEDAGNDHLVNLLTVELGSHYYDTR